ncbi:unnamed protein product [Lactuca saligna]|uniref:Uncharacterized protein n=1 Tax=Lactuca saligna TaxID=75948 RepID=A0AA36DYV1_LACSI|nr:unnamed protein product [Lactuca saligna]
MTNRGCSCCRSWLEKNEPLPPPSPFMSWCYIAVVTPTTGLRIDTTTDVTVLNHRHSLLFSQAFVDFGLCLAGYRFWVEVVTISRPKHHIPKLPLSIQDRWWQQCIPVIFFFNHSPYAAFKAREYPDKPVTHKTMMKVET